MISNRSHQLELIDLGPSYYTPKEYHDCLYQLGRIGQFLGGDRATLKAFKQLKTSPSSILDVGCGGGFFTILLASSFPDALVVGVDISQEAITIAKDNLKRLKTPLPHIQFFVPITPKLDESSQFDVVTATLVCHHLSDQELISFLKQACHVAKQAVILNDLHRHPLATLGFAMLTPLFFRNRLIWHDGLLSIRRAFTKQDWWAYLEAAGIDKRYCTVTWHWAFRWIVYIDAAQMKKEKRGKDES